MEITTELVNHLAELSRLEFTAEETENFKHEFAKTLEQIQTLEDANLDCFDKVETTLDAEQDLKLDEAGESLKKEEVIKNGIEYAGEVCFSDEYGEQVYTKDESEIGNKIDLDTATQITNSLITKDGHIPLPTRLADIMTHEIRKKYL